jgi:hypothetical protein
MPGALESCVNNVYADGNIPASPGIPPTRVLLRDPIAGAILEAAYAADVLDGISGELMIEAASASDTVDATAGVAPARSAMLPDVLVNSGTSREAQVGGVMVNL